MARSDAGLFGLRRIRKSSNIGKNASMEPCLPSLLNGNSTSSKSWNICYLNVIMQALLPVMINWAHDTLKRERNQESKSFQLASIFSAMCKTVKPLDMRPVLSLVTECDDSFKVGAQNDPHELLQALLDCVDDKSFSQIFAFRTIQRIQCLSCLYSDDLNNVKREKQTTLILNLYPFRHSSISLQELLKDYQKPKQVRDYICSAPSYFDCLSKSGSKRTDAQITTGLLYPLHAVLIVLGRVAKHSKKNRSYLIFNETEIFPTYNTDLGQNYKQKKTLIAAVVHLGKSITSGHYYVYVRNINNSNWYFFNDSERRPSNFAEIQRDAKDVYMLLYV